MMDIDKNIQYKVNYARLLNSQTLENNIEALYLIKNSCLNVLIKTKPYNNKSNNAIILFEKTLFNTESIFCLLEAANNNTLKYFPIEPFSLIVRNVLESYVLFNNIFISHKEDESDFLFYIWSIATLNKRQQFKRNDLPKNLLDKFEKEKKQLQEYKEKIKLLNVYKKHQITIDNFFKNENFFAYEKQFKDNKIVNYNNFGRLVEIGFNDEIFDKAYSILSSTSHPTHASVFMYADYKRNIKGQKELTLTMLKFCSSLLSSFLYDFIIIFPSSKEHYKLEPKINQLIIDSYNKVCRGDKYRLSPELIDYLK